MKKVFWMLVVVTLLTCTFGQFALAETGISPMMVCDHMWVKLAGTFSSYTYLSAARHLYSVYKKDVCAKCQTEKREVISTESSYHEWMQISKTYLAEEGKYEYRDQCKQCKKIVTTIH